MTEREQEPSDAEVPVEDALEQRAEVIGDSDGSPDASESDDPGEADPTDRAEQGKTVDTGDDEYR
jgi:hypothetical protein